jgi:hypothetical protein
VLVVFTSIPFLYELKILMDYAFTQTSLTLFDEFRLVNIYYTAYKAKMQYYTATSGKLGDHQSWVPWRIVGLLGFILILLIIFGPMILFSELNPIAEPNLVVSGEMELGLQV